MNRRTTGFTLIELLLVVVIGFILTGMAIKGFGPVSSQISVREARNVFNGMVARTRAQAIESGQTTFLVVDAQGDSVVILADGATVENVRFGEVMGVDIQTAAEVTQICMTPRGYANTDCNSFDSTTEMAFVRGTMATTIEILPLGQILW